MTYYKQFAAMLGLELEQEFNLVTNNGKKANTNTYKIKEDGLYCQSATKDYWFVTSAEYLDILLSGEFKAAPKPWKPKHREEFYFYGADHTVRTVWLGTPYDYCRWKLGNCFKTREEAEVKGKEIMEQIYKEYGEA